MNISFVLAIYNKLELTKECYKNLRNVYPNAPLVISSGGSSDGTKEWLESLSDENLSLFHDDDREGGSDDDNLDYKPGETKFYIPKYFLFIFNLYLSFVKTEIY
jgi:glycosyltransferase involved in cell wall biosynthesis